jgi:hypothetical protein
MDDHAHAAHAPLDECPITYRSDDIGERRGEKVHADHGAPRQAQAAHERLAEMAGAAGNESGHRCLRADLYQRAVPTDRLPASLRIKLPSWRWIGRPYGHRPCS